MQSEFHHKVYNIPIITFISPIKCQPVHNVKTVSASQDIIKPYEIKKECRAQQASTTAKIIIMAFNNVIRRKRI